MQRASNPLQILLWLNSTTSGIPNTSARNGKLVLVEAKLWKALVVFQIIEVKTRIRVVQKINIIGPVRSIKVSPALNCSEKRPSSLNTSWQKDNRYNTRFIILATRKTLHQLWFLPPSPDLARSQLKGLQFLWERYWQLRTPRTNLYTIFEPHREIAAFVISKTANTSYNKLLLGRNAHLEHIAVS